VPPPLTPHPAAPSATSAATKAAAEAGVTITALTDAPGAHQAARLLAGIWASDQPGLPISAHAVRALAHTGNYVVGAWSGPELVGASIAFLGAHHGRLQVHSHITGTAAAVQRSSIGFALKQHQRAWSLQRGIEEVTWTFDPLVRRNAWFNLRKLRAVATAYEADFYGPMEDGINADDPSDRCLVTWDLLAPAVTAAAARSGPGGLDPDPAGPLLLDAGDDGRPVVAELGPVGAGPYRCRVPADVEGLRASEPGLAGQWRLALRHTMGAAMAGGLVAAAVTRDGCYVLTRPRDQERTG
jgi:predicted GNAT superfamily acetyltransferase